MTPVQKTAAIIQLARKGDIVSALPIAWHLSRSGYRVDFHASPDFADVLEACSYVEYVPVTTHHRDVAGTAKRIATKYNRVLATQVDGNDLPLPKDSNGCTPDDGESFIVKQWVRAGWVDGVRILDLFHDLPLIFDQRDAVGEAAAVAKHLPPSRLPYLLYCLKGHSSPFTAVHLKPDDAAERFERWLQTTFASRFCLVNLGTIQLAKSHHLLGLLEKAAALVSIDTMPIHLAYATGTPTIVLSRNHPHYMSEARSHWRYRSTYDKANAPEVRKEMEKVLNGIAGGDLSAGDNLCRMAAEVTVEPLIHVVDYYLSTEGTPDRRRVLQAEQTWKAMRDQDKAYSLVYHVTARDAKRTSKTLCGDTRDLPVIKDVIDFGCAAAEAAGRPDGIVFYTNSDIGLCPEAASIIRAAMANGAPCAFSRRKDVVSVNRRFTLEDLRSTPDHCGADLFAVRASFWRKHSHELPDLLISFEGWDFVCRHWMLKYNPSAQMPTAIFHERHSSFWSKPENITRHVSQQYNRKLCQEWAVANGFEDAIFPTGNFLFKPDGSFKVRPAAAAVEMKPEPAQPRRPLVYDVFPFFRELDLLEIRLHELRDVVDFHIIVESNRTYTGKPKPLAYRDNAHLFREFAHKIISIVVDDMPATDNPWDREGHQNERGMHEARKRMRPGDMMILGDADEIPRPEHVKPYAQITALEPAVYSCYLNYRNFGRVTLRPAIVPYPQVLTHTWGNVRKPRQPWPEIKNAAWHFTDMGGPERVIQKLEAFSHAGEQGPLESIEQIRNGIMLEQRYRHELTVVPLDDHPRYVRENQQRMRDLGLIGPGVIASIDAGRAEPVPAMALETCDHHQV